MKPSETMRRQRRRQWALRAAVVAALAALIVPWNASSATGRVYRPQLGKSVVSSRPLVVTDVVTATTTATVTVTAVPTTTITASDVLTATPGASGTPTPAVSPTTTTAASGTLTWDTSITRLPTALTRPAVAVGLNGDLYAFGGGNGVRDYATTYIYNPRGNRWRQGAPMPVAREGARAVTLPDGRIAVLGGATPCDGSSNGNICDGGTVYNRADVYTPGTDSWAALAPMHSPRYRFAAVLYHEQIYAMGGSDGKGVVASVEAYDPASNAWQDAASLPRSLEGPAAAVANDRIDVFGGFPGQANGGPIYDSHYRYDGGAWTTGAPLLQAATDAGAALGPDGRIYVIGGFDNGFLATVQADDPRAGRWSYAPSLPVPTCCTGAVTAPDGQMYAVGADGPGPNPQVAVYGPYVSTADPAGTAGSTTTVIGNGFAPGDTVDLYWGATSDPLLSQATADVYGQIRVVVTIPATATTGYHTVTALDVQASYPVTTGFVVCNCSAPTATPTAMLTAIPATITSTVTTTRPTPTALPTGAPTGLTFGTPVTYSVGSRPAYVAVGDFDGDGKPDLAVVNSGDGTVSVLRGRGDGTFARAVTYTVGASPEFLVAADLDGDGKLDLVVANSGDDTVSVLHGRGDGTFAPTVSYAAGANPQALAVADVNGDGKPDLAVANFGPAGGHTVSVLLNRCDGTFSGAVSYDAGPGPRSVAAADLTGNGKTDLVVASNTSGDVTVLRGRGDGTFAPPVAYDSGGAQPSIVALGDLDGDGRPDIAVTHDTGDSATIDHVSVLHGRGDGTFGAATSYATGSRPQDVIVADLAGNGHPDLAVANTLGSTIGVYPNNGDGTFGSAEEIAAGEGLHSVAAADLTGDGKLDLIVTNPDSNAVGVLRNGITPATPTSTPAAVPTAADAVSWDTGTTALPRPLSRPAAAVGVDGRIYVFGGTANGTESNATSIYDPTANSWSSGASMPTAREGARAVTLPDGRIAVLGGGSLCGTGLCDRGIVYDRVEVYDPAANSWATLPHMPTPRYRPVVALLGGRLYAIGGSDGHSVVASAESLDLSTNIWSPAPGLPHPVQAAAGAADALGHIDVAGGADNTANVNTLYIFDGASWHNGASLPEPTADMNGTLGPDGNVYVIGGYDRTWVTTVQVYDPRQGSWSLGTSLPAPTCCAGAASVGQRLYALGGADGTGAPTAQVAVGRLARYPAPTTAIGLTWDTSRTSLPQGRARAAVAVGHDGNIYAFGGLAFSHPNGVYTGAETATTYIYHPLTNAWTQGAPLPVAREGARAVTLPDGRIAVLGGGTHCVGNSDLCNTGTVTNRVDVYDPGADAWSSLASMRSPRYRFAAALYHGRIYAIGGSNGSSVLSSVESYDPATDSWSPAASLPRAEEAPVALVDGAGKLDVAGGMDGGSTSYDTLFLFDGTAWSSGPRLPQPVDDAGATPGPGGRVYVIGGFDIAANHYTARVQVYDPRKATWSEVALLPVPVSNMGAVTAVGGQLYAIGAYDGDGVPGVEAQVAIYGPSISVDALTVMPGSTISASGTGFTPHGTVALSLDSSGVGLVKGTADISGAINLPLTIPLTTTNGPHTVTALDVGAGYPVTTSIVVRTDDTATTPAGTATPSGGTIPVSATPSPGSTTAVATVASVTGTSTTTTAPAFTPSPSPIPATATSTATVRPISSMTATGTPMPALTATATPTNTPVPPTATSVPRAPTDTPVLANTAAPSDTSTPTRAAATPMSTPLAATPTSTPIPPTNIPATATTAPTNAPTSAGAPNPSNTPPARGTGGTSTGSGTRARMSPATPVPSSTPTRSSPAHGGGGVTIVFVDVPHGNVASGGTVGVRLRTAPHALVGITLRLTHTSYALVKHGAHRTRVARTQLLFHSLTHPRADARGQAREGIRIAYVTAHALSATLTITAHLPSGSATQSQPVTIQPPHIGRKQARPRP